MNLGLKWPGRVLMLAALAAAPWLVGDFTLFLLTEILIIGLVAASLGFLTGFAGMPSLGHAAYLGVGGYTTAIVATGLTDHAIIQLVVAVFASGLIAAGTGWIAVRTRGVFFLMITLAFSQLFFSLTQSWQTVTGGSNGFTGIPRVSLIPGDEGATLRGDTAFYFYALIAVVIGYFLLRRVLDSPFGTAMVGIRENAGRMKSLGYGLTTYRLAAFSIAGAAAGFGGSLLVQHVRFISPGDVAFERSALLLIMVIVGGSRTLYGPMIGAGVVILLEHELSSRFSEHWEIWLGAIFIAVVYLFPEGIGGVFRRLGRRVGARPQASRLTTAHTPTAQQARACTVRTDKHEKDGPVLQTVDIGKLYGSLIAVDGVSIALEAGRRHGLIGPNGAGKTTLFHLISGAVPSTSGSIALDGRDITGVSEHERARLGIGRTFQQGSVFDGLAARDNVRLSLMRAAGLHRSTLGRLDRHHGLMNRAEMLLDEVGLAERAGTLAGALSHGERRHLELALTLAPNPAVVMLDEPTAGMTQAEVSAFKELITGLSHGPTFLIVEHDMDVVFGLAEWIFVMNAGVLLEEGPPDHIRRSSRVQEAYLGTNKGDDMAWL